MVKIRIIIDNTNFLAENSTKVDFFDMFIFNNVKSDFKIMFCQPNKTDSGVKKLYLHRLYLYRNPRWAEVGQTYIHNKA